MQGLFKSFCAGKEGVTMMDNANFAKMTRDLKLLDKKLTATEVDAIFDKVKSKSEQKINFEQFDNALRLLAEKKYPGDADGYNKLKKKMLEGKGHKTVGTTKASNGRGVGKQTDTSKCPRSVKGKCDEFGKEKGQEGRKK